MFVSAEWPHARDNPFSPSRRSGLGLLLPNDGCKCTFRVGIFTRWDVQAGGILIADGIRRTEAFISMSTTNSHMSLSRDALLFSILLMVGAVQAEIASGGSSTTATDSANIAFFLGLTALFGSAISSLYSPSQDVEPESAE